MLFLYFFLTILGLTATGILLEKGIHTDLGLIECTRKFKADVRSIIHVLFVSGTTRHIFDESLTESFLLILSDFHHTAFTPIFQVAFLEKVPVIRISFVPVRKLTDEELQTLCRLITTKFGQYLKSYGLNWRYFAVYHRLSDSVVIHLYFCEFEEDYQPFMKRYRVSVRQKSTPDFGVLHDENLDRELKRVR